ncbi:E2 [Ailuropoda melanoleuca papillomavirus 4]|uniref:Regulatory protein E2 n=1 Tax=Ailuropoda melanoleuca papillomavirus 4 TaxID=2016453 RepID=A0A220IGF8_9PAPI|nr:E2 [Ailuropoda melanoleuca papillomavirus 4]ASH99072.1 E2 [Ailuropoda melanoleuca papillomavirus 4]
METLNELLDYVQDQLLILYETNSNKIADQIKHWHLNRKENVLLYYARKNGITRLGMRPIPSLQVSHQKARAAIEQELMLQSLGKSNFGSEKWTLQDTSKERLLAEPRYCFKKGGKEIDVRFDNKAENITRYTLWDWIYYQDDNDKWQKTEGQVDERGLFYLDQAGVKVYYVNFEEESKKYGKTGAYEVLHKLTKNAISTSSFRSSSGGESEHPTSSGLSSRHSTPRKKIHSPGRRTRRYRRRASPCVSRGRRERESPPKEHPARRLLPPSPGEVGGCHHTSQAGAGGRLERLVQEARDPPLLVLGGNPNSLKCLRFRLRKGYGGLFDTVSTTWQWTNVRDPKVNHRMLVAFTDTQQREQFLLKVPLPKSVSHFFGSFNGL